ncbi:hypothetical protein CXG81DRAFT_18568 [Caulochytrium protostelioides]|uniref:Uncharacterized protein n=1 Tax=Caulochytrium protostelioides TaxID=1555241 RepID=A0A4P9X9D6_9FUNG|nr:hypothetical protein CXG81DRAFT_18568 [Caulochytrium protostelioides]|eukprot:RKP01690.1 hypothetical protein CXG81DRAFT_18568 [Caulochytrium protostelioides]
MRRDAPSGRTRLTTGRQRTLPGLFGPWLLIALIVDGVAVMPPPRARRLRPGDGSAEPAEPPAPASSEFLYRFQHKLRRQGRYYGHSHAVTVSDAPADPADRMGASGHRPNADHAASPASLASLAYEETATHPDGHDPDGMPAAPSPAPTSPSMMPAPAMHAPVAARPPATDDRDDRTEITESHWGATPMRSATPAAPALRAVEPATATVRGRSRAAGAGYKDRYFPSAAAAVGAVGAPTPRRPSAPAAARAAATGTTASAPSRPPRLSEHDVQALVAAQKRSRMQAYAQDVKTRRVSSASAAGSRSVPRAGEAPPPAAARAQARRAAATATARLEQLEAMGMQHEMDRDRLESIRQRVFAM